MRWQSAQRTSGEWWPSPARYESRRHTLSVYDVPAKPELKNLHYRNHQPYVITYNHINNLKFNKNLINSPVTTAAQIQLLRDVSTTESVDLQPSGEYCLITIPSLRI